MIAQAAFVDGSHIFHNVFVDLFYLQLIVQPGGLIILDDHWWPGVATAAQYFETNQGWRPQTLTNGTPGRLRALRLPDQPVQSNFKTLTPFWPREGRALADFAKVSEGSEVDVAVKSWLRIYAGYIALMPKKIFLSFVRAFSSDNHFRQATRNFCALIVILGILSLAIGILIPKPPLDLLLIVLIIGLFLILSLSAYSISFKVQGFLIILAGFILSIISFYSFITTGMMPSMVGSLIWGMVFMGIGYRRFSSESLAKSLRS